MTGSDTPKVTRYVAAGLPTHCFLPLCWKTFENTCIHAADGHYYCSNECADKGSRMDLTRVEELRPKATAIPMTPKQKLSGL
jgi:hypothetical protein